MVACVAALPQLVMSSLASKRCHLASAMILLTLLVPGVTSADFAGMPPKWSTGVTNSNWNRKRTEVTNYLSCVDGLREARTGCNATQGSCPCDTVPPMEPQAFANCICLNFASLSYADWTNGETSAGYDTGPCNLTSTSAAQNDGCAGGCT